MLPINLTHSLPSGGLCLSQAPLNHPICTQKNPTRRVSACPQRARPLSPPSLWAQAAAMPLCLTAPRPAPEDGGRAVRGRHPALKVGWPGRAGQGGREAAPGLGAGTRGGRWGRAPRSGRAGQRAGCSHGSSLPAAGRCVLRCGGAKCRVSGSMLRPEPLLPCLHSSCPLRGAVIAASSVPAAGIALRHEPGA